MRRYFLGLLMPLFVGCSVENVVAGEERTKSEQLETALPAWCENVCSRSESCSPEPCPCPSGGCSCAASLQDCVSACELDMWRFTRGGDDCAAIGERLKTCRDTAVCADGQGGTSLCQPTTAEKIACPDTTGELTSPPVGSKPAVPNKPPVTCLGGQGTGAASDVPTAPNGHLTCMRSLGQCSDAHDYEMRCFASVDTPEWCSCFIDDKAVGAFTPKDSDSCYDELLMNTGCGWNVAIASSP